MATRPSISLPAVGLLVAAVAVALVLVARSGPLPVGLGWLGSKPAEGGYVISARILTFYYFAHFFIILPVLGWVEKTKPLPNSISESILTSKRVTG